MAVMCLEKVRRGGYSLVMAISGWVSVGGVISNVRTFVDM